MTIVLCQKCRAALNGRNAIDRAIRASCNFFGVAEADFRSSFRMKSIAMARHVVAHVLKRTLGKSYTEIARDLGLKHHTSVIDADRKISRLVTKDERIRRAVEIVSRATTGSTHDEADDAAE